MKITIESDGMVASIEDKEAITLSDVIPMLENSLLAVGYRFKGTLDIQEDE